MSMSQDNAGHHSVQVTGVPPLGYRSATRTEPSSST